MFRLGSPLGVGWLKGFGFGLVWRLGRLGLIVRYFVSDKLVLC